MSEQLVERRGVSVDTFHKYITTFGTIVMMLWGGMVYYITAEDEKNKLIMEARIVKLEAAQKIDEKVNELVFGIDSRLARMEQILLQQSGILMEVKELRSEVNKLKVAIHSKGT